MNAAVVERGKSESRPLSPASGLPVEPLPSVLSLLCHRHKNSAAIQVPVACTSPCHPRPAGNRQTFSDISESSPPRSASAVPSLNHVTGMPWAAGDRYLPQQLGASQVGGLGCCTTEDVEERVLFSKDRAQLVSSALRVRLRLGQLPAASGSRDGLATDMGTGSGPGVSEWSLPVPKISD